MSSYELANALEMPLLGAHPSPPQAGNILFYTLLSDLREYYMLDTGERQYRHPQYWHWKVGLQANTASNQWLRNVDSSPQTRRTNLLCPFELGRLANLTFSSRQDLATNSRIRLRIFEEAIGSSGDISLADTITADIFSDDSDVTSFINGKRFLVDLRSRNIELDSSKRYAITIDNIGDGTFYRDVRVEVQIEERVVQP